MARLCAIKKCVEPEAILALAKRVDLSPGELRLQLDKPTTASLLGCDPEELQDCALHFNTLFAIRKRGVETKLIFPGAQTTKRDEALIRNIAKAHQWFEQIKAGQSFAQIAMGETTSKRRIQQVVPLAFLAPDIIRDVLNGTHPIGFTSDWCMRHAIPTNWDDQRAMIKTL